MIYLYLAIALFIASPFLFIGAGFLYSLTERGEKGIQWRINIAVAFDRLIAACLNYPDKMTLCGYIGRRSLNSNNFSWKVYIKLIELLPWFEKGHCLETAEKEKHL
jgi:hypothetical protein